MPSCDYCGEEFGNEGAKTSHEAHCDERPSPEDQEAPKPARAEQSGRPPAREPQRPGDAPAPATDADAVEVGMQVGDSLARLNSGDPEERAQAEGTLLKSVGAAFAQLGQRTAKSKLKRIRNAKNTDDGELKASEDFPRCPECDSQIQEIPGGQDTFPCPECGAQLERK